MSAQLTARPAPVPLASSIQGVSEYRPDVGTRGEEERFRRRERAAIRAAQAGDWEGVQFLYVRYADRICRIVRAIVGDPHSAQDVTQDVFAKLLRAIRSYEPQEVPFSAWIARVARNAALDHVRGRRQIPVAEVRLDEHRATEMGASPLEALKLALADLSEAQRQVLVLRHIGGYSPGEIAARLDRTESSVQALHHRGRAKVKLALRDLGAAPRTRAC